MSAAKRKGDTFERAVVEVLRANGHPYAERVLRLGAHDDRGDIAGCPGLHVDCKNHQRYQLAVWLDEVIAEAPAGSAPVVVVKRPGVGAARAYAVLELATFAALMAG